MASYDACRTAAAAREALLPLRGAGEAACFGVAHAKARSEEIPGKRRAGGRKALEGSAPPGPAPDIASVTPRSSV